MRGFVDWGNADFGWDKRVGSIEKQNSMIQAMIAIQGMGSSTMHV